MRKLLLFIPIVLILTALSGSVNGDNMTHITDVTGLQNMSLDLTEDYILDNDIDATGFAFTPVGTQANKFTGSFDGQGFVITGLTVNTPLADYAGLFGFVQSANDIGNVELRNCNITGKDYVGALIGNNNGASVTSCSASGSVSSPTRAAHILYIAGLIGNSNGLITNCSFEGSVTVGNATGDKDITAIAGLIGGQANNDVIGCHAVVILTTGNAGDEISGIAGLIGGNIANNVSNSYSVGSLTIGNAVDNITNVGGLFGSNNGNISDSYSTVDIVIGDSAGAFGIFYVGGFIGRCDASALTRCRATGSITTGDATVAGFGQIGGFIGYSEATISQCSSRGNVVLGNAATNSGQLGGFIGSGFEGNVSDSYARGSVTIGDVLGNLWDLGGFTGRLRNGAYARVYSVGSVNYGVVGGALTNVGGLVGNITGTGTVDAGNCFWDTESSGLVVSAGGTGKTTAQMNASSTFTDAGFDFTTIWNICSPPTPAYPWLQWEGIECVGAGVVISLIA